MQVQLRRQGQGYTVQAGGHRLECRPAVLTPTWSCSCGFRGNNDGAEFDPLHLALRMYAEREELRDAVERFLRREMTYKDLREAIAALR
jgi:hypothetical protein